jgi:hypothetical protein
MWCKNTKLKPQSKVFFNDLYFNYLSCFFKSNCYGNTAGAWFPGDLHFRENILPHCIVIFYWSLPYFPYRQPTLPGSLYHTPI